MNSANRWMGDAKGKGEDKGEGMGEGKDNGDKLPAPAVWHRVWRWEGETWQYMERTPLHESWKSAAKAVAAEAAAARAAREEGWRPTLSSSSAWRQWTR